MVREIKPFTTALFSTQCVAFITSNIYIYRYDSISEEVLLWNNITIANGIGLWIISLNPSKTKYIYIFLKAKIKHIF